MKSLILILEGAADEPVAELDGRTALQAAAIPTLDRIASEGRLGVTHLVPAGWQPRAEVSLLSCLGYDPKQFPAGRGALEAAAIGLECAPRDQALRCNFVTVVDGVLRDASPARLTPPETEALVEIVRRARPSDALDLSPLGGHRALAVWRDAGPVPALCTRPPHDVLDQPIRANAPTGRGARALATWMKAAQEALAECELNGVRRDLGENPITGIWLWGEGPRPRLPMFRERFGVGAAAMGENALFRGVARVARLETAAVQPNGEGNSLAALVRAAIDAIERFDVVIVHASDADSAGHIGAAAGKVEALERLDAGLVAPLLETLRLNPAWRVLALTAHATPSATRRHADIATPFALAGTRLESNRGEAFDESHAATGELRLERGCDLMEYFLRT